MNQQKIDVHLLAVPFPLEGHVNGMLRLAQTLSVQDGVLISFAYPACFHRSAHTRNKLAALQNYPMLHVEVVDDGMPLEEELTITPDILLAAIPIFKNAVKVLLYNLLRPNEPSSASTLPPPCCIISDTFCPWSQALADAATLPRIEFWTSTAAVYSMGSQLSSLVSNGILPLPKSCWPDIENKWTAHAPLIDSVPGLPPFPVTDLPCEFVYPEVVSDPRLQFMLAAFGHSREAHTIFVHSVYEFESEVFDALQADGYPIQAVGPLLDSHIETSMSAHANSAAKHECLEWLDKQSPSSVIYVAFGSIAKLNAAEMHSLAFSLEASGHPFLWVIRRDAMQETVGNALLEGFLQRTTAKGLAFIIDWAPQTKVLSHRSIGVFFSHCGWNSTLECIWEGVPMVACPRGAEQRSNARWIVEKLKIGVEVERQLDGSFTKEAVQMALKQVLDSKGMHAGKSYKERAVQAKNLARAAVQKGGSSHSNLVSFSQHLCRSFKP